MAWWVAPLIMGGAKVAMNALNKPKKYTPDTSYIDKFINSKKGDLAGANTYHTAMRGALRNIGANANQANRQIGYDNARSGLSGSGVEAQQRISVQQNTNQAVNQANESAMGMQMSENRQTRNAIDQAMMMKGQLLSEAKQRNQIAEDQYKSNLINSGIDAVAGLATAGVSNAMQTAHVNNQWQDVAQLAGSMVGQAVTPEQMQALGNDPQTAFQVFKNQQNQLEEQQYNQLMNEQYQKLGLQPRPDLGQYQDENLRYTQTQQQNVLQQQEDQQKSDQMQYYSNVMREIPNMTMEQLNSIETPVEVFGDYTDNIRGKIEAQKVNLKTAEEKRIKEANVKAEKEAERVANQQNKLEKAKVEAFGQIGNTMESLTSEGMGTEAGAKALSDALVFPDNYKENDFEKAIDSYLDTITEKQYEDFKGSGANGLLTALLGNDAKDIDIGTTNFRSWRYAVRLSLKNKYLSYLAEKSLLNTTKTSETYQDIKDL